MILKLASSRSNELSNRQFKDAIDFFTLMFSVSKNRHQNKKENPSQFDFKSADIFL